MNKPAPHLVPSRLAKRAEYDRAAIDAILDEALYCTISYSSADRPFAIPTAFVRYKDHLYIHGSVGSHFIREIEKGIPLCISVTLMDALVVARSAFHHSVNYRSVILFTAAEKIEDPIKKTEAFQWLTEKIVPGSWNYLRPIRENEIKKTTLLAMPIKEASAKLRQGMPNDDDEDRALPIWSGLIPLTTQRQAPVSDSFSQAQDLPVPEHLRRPL